MNRLAAMKQLIFFSIFVSMLISLDLSMAVAEEWTIRDTAGRVIVTVTYNNPGEKHPSFDVRMKSNTKNLRQYQMEDLVFLRDEQGNMYKGHWNDISSRRRHRHGEITFTAVSFTNLKEVELVIQEVGGAPVRSFKWRL